MSFVKKIKYYWKHFKGRMRLDLNLVCELSKTMGMYDYHDYPDDEIGTPCHFVILKCKRCGKEFYM